MTRSQNRVSRDSFSEMKFFAMKSAFDWPARPSSMFAPIEVPASSSFMLRRLTTGPRSWSRVHKVGHITREVERPCAELVLVDHERVLVHNLCRREAARSIRFSFLVFRLLVRTSDRSVAGCGASQELGRDLSSLSSLFLTRYTWPGCHIDRRSRASADSAPDGGDTDRDGGGHARRSAAVRRQFQEPPHRWTRACDMKGSQWPTCAIRSRSFLSGSTTSGARCLPSKSVLGIVGCRNDSHDAAARWQLDHGIRVGAVSNSAQFTWVSPGYFSTMGISLRRGRDFTLRDMRNSPRVAIVNETFVKQFAGGSDPIGQTLRTGEEPRYPSTVYKIVGVIPDTRSNRPARRAAADGVRSRFAAPRHLAPTSDSLERGA